MFYIVDAGLSTSSRGERSVAVRTFTLSIFQIRISNFMLKAKVPFEPPVWKFRSF